MRRLIESVNLRVQKAAFTGESEPVEKQTDAISTLELHDRCNIVYKLYRLF
jgi:P-type Ca2+ transporter type 2C